MTDQQVRAGSPFTAQRPEPRPDLVAPGSPLHTALCDASVVLYSLPLFLLPLLHPATAEATARTDPAFQGDEPDAVATGLRLWNTMEMISGVVYARGEQDTAALSVRELHRGMTGELPDGSTYHAWSREIWTWNWAAISASILGVITLRGVPDQGFLDDAYLGLVEVGRRFGVVGMPASHTEFTAVWPAERDRVADPDTPAMRRIAPLVHRGSLARPAGLGWLPTSVWELLLAPVRHFQRIAVQAVVPEHLHAPIGLPPSRSDEVATRVHRAVWRVVPRPLTHQLGRRVLEAHHRRGTPQWRARFAPVTARRRRAG